jgi:hypothetical protein
MLGIGSGSFDPETLVILETAFDEAWITLKANGSGPVSFFGFMLLGPTLLRVR